jgi:hypothetical protein
VVRRNADDDTIEVEQRELAIQVHHRVRVLSGREAIARLTIGAIAGALLRARAYQRLGFARRGDYAQERLGISGRELASLAFVARRLGELPLVRDAFERGALTWTQTRLLCAIAAGDEAAWVARASACTVRELRDLVHAEAARGGAAVHRRLADTDEQVTGDPGDPSVAVRIACPPRLRALWRYALELARRMSGADVPIADAIEAIAAEGLAAHNPPAEVTEPWRFRRTEPESRSTEPRPRAGIASLGVAAVPTVAAESRRALATRSADAALPAGTHHDILVALAASLDGADPFELDRRLRVAVHALRTIEPQMGTMLRLLSTRRLFRFTGATSLESYVDEWLDISARKAWALVRVSRNAARASAFSAAYAAGTLSWVRAQTILPAIDEETAPAWIARAQAVTLRRLRAEVDWAIDRRDRSGNREGFAPPPPDFPVAVDLRVPIEGDDLQIGAAETVTDRVTRPLPVDFGTYTCDGEIRFVAPASVVTVFRRAVRAHAEASEPYWRAVERLVRVAIEEWEGQPRHRDPIFARDGWRCVVPACGARAQLHDHHLQFRSRCGGNEQANRTSVCVVHHQYGIHAGYVRAAGRAPDDIRWWLGVRPGRRALMELVGDRYVRGHPDWAVATAPVHRPHVAERSPVVYRDAVPDPR